MRLVVGWGIVVGSALLARMACAFVRRLDAALRQYRSHWCERGGRG
jgi:hypothetical protein